MDVVTNSVATTSDSGSSKSIKTSFTQAECQSPPMITGLDGRWVAIASMIRCRAAG